MIPPGTSGLRVVGDVHGNSSQFAAACATDRFIIQLGDLTDHGPDSAGVLRLALDMVEQGRGLFLLGNHDRKLGRALAGEGVRMDTALEATLAQLDDELRARALPALRQAPAWLLHHDRFFVHGAFHPAMLLQPPPEDAVSARPDHLLSRALFGQVTGLRQADGYPVRLHHWVLQIPPGLTVYVGHDMQSTDGRPVKRRNPAGGAVVFLDTGGGKGGHVSWVDLVA